MWGLDIVEIQKLTDPGKKLASKMVFEVEAGIHRKGIVSSLQAIHEATLLVEKTEKELQRAVLVDAIIRCIPALMEAFHNFKSANSINEYLLSMDKKERRGEIPNAR